MPVFEQGSLFPILADPPARRDNVSSTFTDNMRLPVHRWFRYSAGFSAAWAASVIALEAGQRETRVFDPFAGSGTTLLCAEDVGVESYGVDAHPFVSRIAQAKLMRRSDPAAYEELVRRVGEQARRITPTVDHYSELIRRCYADEVLSQLDQLRLSVEAVQDGSPASQLVWLTLVGILRKVSHVGTASWQYVLPNKTKSRPASAFPAFEQLAGQVLSDMRASEAVAGPRAHFLQGDARTCEGVPTDFATLVVTSPPYPNNYDYADATRLEMTFLGEIAGWGGLQQAVRQYLVRSCSQHVPERAVDLEAVLSDPILAPIRDEITPVCRALSEIRLTKGGKKTYHLMVATYFLDLARVWLSLRRVCASPCRVCFVIGDAAPYGVYVPAVEWLGELAQAAGFHGYEFERTRDRNVKWKNRKHDVPLCEGRLWVRG